MFVLLLSTSAEIEKKKTKGKTIALNKSCFVFCFVLCCFSFCFLIFSFIEFLRYQGRKSSAQAAPKRSSSIFRNFFNLSWFFFSFLLFRFSFSRIQFPD